MARWDGVSIHFHYTESHQMLGAFHRMPGDNFFEMLQIARQVPGDFTILPNHTVFRICHNDADH
jgi:hypothetical protein